MNITDVGHLTSDSDTGEDKMEKGARRENKTAWEIADFYTKAFFEDIKRLNIIKANIICKATDHIKEQLELIKKLEKKSYTYVIEDGVYFDTSKLKDYGKLAKLKKEDLLAGARVEVVKGKKHPTDFALWKFSPKDEKRQMEWPSPFGIGFPGWHIECSAMSMKYLGESFDIHCGGIDHIPIHHTNEIAQSEAATGKRFVNYWLHNEFVILKDNVKMAKSGENFITLNELIKRNYSPEDYRYLCLTTHYRKPLMFSYEALDGAKNSLQKLKNHILDIKKNKKDKNPPNIKKYKEEFLKAINDDLNTPEALAVLWNLIKDSDINNNSKYKLILDFDNIFGLNLSKIKQEKISGEIIKLAEEREKARKTKNWKKADQLREEIRSKGYLVEDSEKGFLIKNMQLS